MYEYLCMHFSQQMSEFEQHIDISLDAATLMEATLIYRTSLALFFVSNK